MMRNPGGYDNIGHTPGFTGHSGCLSIRALQLVRILSSVFWSLHGESRIFLYYLELPHSGDGRVRLTV